MADKTQSSGLHIMSQAEFVLDPPNRSTTCAYKTAEIKCSGGGPPCSACHFITSECVYETSRRDRFKEFVCQACFASSPRLIKCRATQLNHTLTALLRDLSKHVDSHDQKRIVEALEEVRFLRIAAFLALDCDLLQFCVDKG